MTYKNASKNKPVGVIGTGSFGTAVANLLAENHPVILYSRRSEKVEEINRTKMSGGQVLHNRITATNDKDLLCDSCKLIFPSVPSKHFRSMLRDFASRLLPDHILIHTTKGLDVVDKDNSDDEKIGTITTASDVLTMSQVIMQETNVKRIGCMSGPNLARELALKQPAATVIASKFDEVIEAGRFAIRSPRFQVYCSHNIIGIELAGVLKNSLALAAGALNGMNLGQNALAFLISRGIREMIQLGEALGADKSAFLGLAGIGDIIATCTSPLSRNFNVGYRIAQGETLEYILSTSSEVAEGLRTVNICNMLGKQLGLDIPIIFTTYRVLFEDMDLNEGLSFLMNYKNTFDVDFI